MRAVHPMIRTLLTTFVSCILFSATQVTFALDVNSTKPTINTPKATRLVPAAPTINASGYILLDIDSNDILVEKNADQKMEPASLTKLMTVYVLFDAIKSGQVHLDDEVRISIKAWKAPGSRMFVQEGQNVSIDELIRGIVVVSGNDASIAVAEYIAGSEESFASLMNKEAQAIGMSHSHFDNATGLPSEQHYTTPRDMALLAQAIQINFPKFQHYFEQKWYKYNDIRQPNRNRMLWRDDYVTGMKTGHTESAGYCLVTSSAKEDMRLTTVVMGAPTDSARTDDSQRLLTYGYRFFATHQLYAAHTQILAPRIYGAADKHTAIGLSQALNVTIPRGQRDKLVASVELETPVKAPIKTGQVLGKLIVNLDGAVIVEEPLVALNDNPKGGLWRRFSDSISMKFNNWFGSDDVQSSS